MTEHFTTDLAYGPQLLKRRRWRVLIAAVLALLAGDFLLRSAAAIYGDELRSGATPGARSGMEYALSTLYDGDAPTVRFAEALLSGTTLLFAFLAAMKNRARWLLITVLGVGWLHIASLCFAYWWLVIHSPFVSGVTYTFRAPDLAYILLSGASTILGSILAVLIRGSGRGVGPTAWSSQ